MKKFMILIAAIGAMMSASAQTTASADAQQTSVEQTVKAASKSAGIEQYQLGVQLAKWGYSNGSPTALIESARILSEVQTEELDAEYTQGQGSEAQGENENTFTVDQLLSDAKTLAEGDKAIIAQADEVSTTVSRGAVGGPKIRRTYVHGNSTDTFKVKFRKNELAEVALSGDGDTDLDLYIYDANGNPIACDNDYSDDCYTNWVPAWTGTYYIKVVNQGSVRNYYTIVTN